MFKNILFWLLAFIITAASVVYQRKTGPNHPVESKVTINNELVKYKLERSHSGDTDQPVSITIPDTSVTAQLIYKRYKTNDEWTALPMTREADVLTAFLPNQPAAGKLEYHIEIASQNSVITIPEARNIITRFNGEVPISVLIPHILFMFLGMLFSTRVGLEALRKNGKLKVLTVITTILIFIGGMILGPLVQKFAFNAYWTGFPFGMDLTDNKTLIALIFWIIALFHVYKNKRARGWVFAAAIVTLIIFLIPHSVMGSELDYSKMDAQQQVEMVNE